MPFRRGRLVGRLCGAWGRYGVIRDKALNALRQLIDEVDAGRFPRLYLVITGLPAFFEGRSGIARLAPLEQRLATDFTTDPRFDNPRAVQIRLPGFDRARLLELGVKVRDLYAGGSAARTAYGRKSTTPASDRSLIR